MTLSHAAQVRRFLALVDQIRVLCEDEKITEGNIDTLFEMAGLKSSEKHTFDVADFGVCEVEDLLAHISDAPQPVAGAAGNAGNGTTSARADGEYAL